MQRRVPGRAATLHGPLRHSGRSFRHCGRDIRLHGICQSFDNRNDYGVAELAIGLRVRYLDPPFPVPALKPHQAGAFGRREPPGPGAGLVYQDFRTVLVIAGRQGPGRHRRGPNRLKSETVTLRLMLCLVALQIFPEPRSERVFRVNVFVPIQNAAEASGRLRQMATPARPDRNLYPRETRR